MAMNREKIDNCKKRMNKHKSGKFKEHIVF